MLPVHMVPIISVRLLPVTAALDACQPSVLTSSLMAPFSDTSCMTLESLDAFLEGASRASGNVWQVAADNDGAKAAYLAH